MVSEFAAALRTNRLLAILRAGNSAATVDAADVLLEEGVRLLEVSLTGHDALRAIRTIAAAASADAWIGAGTVLTREQARQAADAGAQFIVTPGLCPAIAEALRLGLAVVAGALTPTEVLAAAEQADAVKLFPASFGGVGYLSALRAPFPEVPFVPVGGVDVEQARQYLRVGAVAVGVGSPLIGKAVDGGDLAGLRDRVRQFNAVVTQ